MMNINEAFKTITGVKEAFEFVRDFVNSDSEVNFGRNMITARMFFAYQQQCEEHSEKENFSPAIRKDETIDEIIFNGTIAIVETKINKEIYYYAVGKNEKRKDSFIHATREEALLSYMAHKNNCGEHFGAICKLMNIVD